MCRVLRHSAPTTTLIYKDRPGDLRSYGLKLNRFSGGKLHERGHLALYGSMEPKVRDIVPCVTLSRY